jgi:hypothetical protein
LSVFDAAENSRKITDCFQTGNSVEAVVSSEIIGTAKDCAICFDSYGFSSNTNVATTFFDTTVQQQQQQQFKYINAAHESSFRCQRCDVGFVFVEQCPNVFSAEHSQAIVGRSTETNHVIVVVVVVFDDES